MIEMIYMFLMGCYIYIYIYIYEFYVKHNFCYFKFVEIIVDVRLNAVMSFNWFSGVSD